MGSPFPNWGISSTNVGLTSDEGGELGRGLVARKLGWGTDEVAPGLEFGIEREVEVTGEERLFIGMTLLYPPLHSFSSISTGGRGENILIYMRIYNLQGTGAKIHNLQGAGAKIHNLQGAGAKIHNLQGAGAKIL